MSIRMLRTSLFALFMLAISSVSYGQLRISVSFGPPALPVYEQPLCPGEGYIWTPGYWAWSDDGDYYWVPGTWVMAPEPELFWTPPYWAWNDGGYIFYDGYWGPQVGFYGGIDYGFGYFGDGFVGGRWDHGRFFYNRSVTNVNETIVHNVYNTTVINTSNRTNRISYNGGNGGINARPTPQQEAAMHERHVPPVPAQRQHIEAAHTNTQFRASANHGKPPVAATARPGEFSGREVVPAREAGAPYNPPANRGGNAENNRAEPNRPEPNRPEPNRPASNPNEGRTTYSHAKELPPIERPAAPNTGNVKADQKYQKQQEKMQQQQEQARQKLQNQQEKDHQQLAKRNADDARKQQTEQRHQQQTQQLQQRQVQQQQKIQPRQAPAPAPRREEPKK